MITTNSQSNSFHPSAFTIDVEDGVSIAMRDVFGIKTEQTNRVVINTQKILRLLEQHNVKATFFLLGKVAEDFPFLVKEISKLGHELGVHGYNHLQFFKMTPDEALDELTKSKKLLEDISGEEVIGHRAPAFSVIPSTAWAFDIIAESGFEYDSSIMPINGKIYGWPDFSKEIIHITTSKGNKLTVVPLSITKILGKEIPFSGGGYLRLFPFSFINNSFKTNGKKRSNILYIHPYELDTERYPEYYFKALKQTTFFRQLKMRSYWINRKKTYFKLEKLLNNYSFTTLKNIIYQTSCNKGFGKEVTINTKYGKSNL